jgi:plastocyanin
MPLLFVARLAPTLPALAALPFAALLSAQAPAGSVVERTPNLVHPWHAEPGTLQFDFVHRFTESGAPEHQISSSPTFVLSAATPWRVTGGFVYATNSDVAPGRPNEWEFYARVVPFRARTMPLDVALHLARNVGAASTDAELLVARAFGPVQLLAAARTLGNAFRAGERRSAVVGGASIRLGRYVAVAGDLATLLDRRDDERVAWSAGLQLGVPTTPHSMSLHATNALTATMQGTSRGVARTRYGFEYTVPITLARFIPALRRAPAAPPVAGGAERDDAPAAGASASAAEARAEARADTVVVRMRQLAYEPARIEVRAGAVVVWINDAPLPHTVTADDSTFDSGVIDVDRRWTRRFDRAGTYPYHCTPHPFMKGVVVVR